LRKEARGNTLSQGRKSKGNYEEDEDPIDDVELPNGEVVVEATKVILPSFPYEQIEDHVILNRADSDFVDVDMIKNDFPDLSYAEIETNAAIIDSYYSDNLDYMVLNEVAVNPGIYSNIGTKKQKTSNTNLSEFERNLCLIVEALDNSYGLVRSSFAVSLASLRARSSRTSPGAYYALVSESDSRRDAYRHMLWNSLLAQYYFTISSKATRIEFAKTIANAYEEGMCSSSNNVDTREMDYHNNVIGRKIWNDNTGYRTIFGATIGLNRTSTSHLKNLVLEKIEKHGRYIITDHANISYNYNDIEAKELILLTNVDTPVYIVGDIAPVYETAIVQEFYDCNEGAIAPKQKNKEMLLLGKAPIEDEEIGDCVRNVFVYTPVYQQFITKDTSYNPYFRHNTNPFN